jgi:hypothetical protein
VRNKQTQTQNDHGAERVNGEGAEAGKEEDEQGDNATNTQYSGLAASKENSISAGTTGQYWRGDKSWQTLDKAAVGLGNVDNTSDVNKPVSTAQQTALDGKVDENAPITGATKTKVTYDAKGLVTAGADATTADIADSLNRRYVTDAQQTVIVNTSGTNSGDNATNTQYSGLAASKQDTLVSGTNIKTINSNSILGSGDLVISGGSGLTALQVFSAVSIRM